MRWRRNISFRPSYPITNYFQQQSFSARIITDLGFIWVLEDWAEQIDVSLTKVNKEVDLTTITFLDGKIPLNIGEHILEITYGTDIVETTFKMVPLTVSKMKSQYLLGVELESNIELTFQQDLRQITGVELFHISKETPVGSKELTWNATNNTLQWDFGEPVVISDDFSEYHLLNHMAGVSIADGDYIVVNISDSDELPTENVTEVVIVDVKRYSLEDFQYWINVGYQTLTETIIMTQIEPTLYSSDKDLGYKYLDPVQDLPKKQSESSNFSFEFAVNKLQDIIDLWIKFFAATNRVGINNRVLEFSEDAQIVIRGYPYGSTGFVGASAGSATALGLAGQYDRNIYSNADYGARNKTKNFFNGTVVAGIPDSDKGLRELALNVAASISSISLLLAAGLGKGAGVASRSFSVGGISSSYNSTESAENSLFSGPILNIQSRLGLGKATKEERQYGLVNQLKHKIEGSSMVFKY